MSQEDIELYQRDWTFVERPERVYRALWIDITVA